MLMFLWPTLPIQIGIPLVRGGGFLVVIIGGVMAMVVWLGFVNLILAFLLFLQFVTI